jgi:hypothetical protein
MPTVPRLTQHGAAPAEVLDRGPPAKIKHSTPEERAAEHPRLSVYDDLIAATAHLPAAQRMAIRMPAIMSDPAAFGAGADLQRVVKDKVPPPEDGYAKGQ